MDGSVSAKDHEGAYRGEITHYQDAQQGDWGSYYAFNPARENRPQRRSVPGECPFDDTPRLVAQGGLEFAFRGRDYIFVENISPITQSFHGMVIPREHREGSSLSYNDIAVCGLIAREGLHSVLKDRTPRAYIDQRVAIYCNPVKEAGASQPHLHFCLVPVCGMPVLSMEGISCTESLAPAPLCGTPYGGWITRSSESMFRFVSTHYIGRTAYNFLVLPEDAEPTDIRWVIVPRKAEYGASFRLGGLELMTGVLIPRGEQLDSMSSGLRDEVFLETTFSSQELRQMRASGARTSGHLEAA